jgi:hypothetical protein
MHHHALWVGLLLLQVVTVVLMTCCCWMTIILSLTLILAVEGGQHDIEMDRISFVVVANELPS